MPPPDNASRLLSCAEVRLRRNCSRLALLAFDEVFWGDGSERPGIGRCSPGELAETLASSRRAVVAALDELQATGLILWSQDERVAIRPTYAADNWPSLPNNAIGWHNAILAYREGKMRGIVLESIAGIFNRHEVELGIREKSSASKANRHALTFTERTETTLHHTSHSELHSEPHSEEPKSVSPKVRKEELSTVVPPPAAAPEQAALGFEQLELTFPKPKKPKKPKDPKWDLAEEIRAVWNAYAEHNPDYAPCTKLTTANVNVLANANKRLGGKDGICYLLTSLLPDPWFAGDNRKSPWGITEFFASNNLDKAITQTRRMEAA